MESASENWSCVRPRAARSSFTRRPRFFNTASAFTLRGFGGSQRSKQYTPCTVILCRFA